MPLLLALSFALWTPAVASEPVELTAATFRFLRTESKTFPPAAKDQHPVKVLYGVFAFRHSAPQSLKFWGFNPPSKDGKFTVRFPDYQILVQGAWQRVPVGYCGTGAVTYELASGTDYLLLIPVDMRGLADAVSIRVSAGTDSGDFWSEVFSLPKTKK